MMEAQTSYHNTDQAEGSNSNPQSTSTQRKRKRKTLGTYCAAVGCHNSRRNCNLSMFRFPKNEDLCKKWVQNTRREDIRHLSTHKLYTFELCSNHFEDSQFKNKEKKNRLIRNALPTLFDVPNPPPLVTNKRKSRSSTSTETITSAPKIKQTVQRLPDTPQKQKLKRKVQTLRTKLWRKSVTKKLAKKAVRNKLVTELRDYLPSNTVNFVERQILLHESKKSHRRYTVVDKMMALSIFYQSRKAYGILSKHFALPSKSTLHRSMQKTNILPGFVDAIFEALKLKICTLDNKDKNVALVFDEMSLETDLRYNHGLDKVEGFKDLGELGSSHYVADHALVFMVRGLYTKWKQPLAYFLTAGTIKAGYLQSLTRKCIDKLDQIGLNVRVIICDQGSNNRSFFQTLENVTIEKPYIVHNHKKVLVMYDPPHLIKNVRNNFMKSDYKYDDVDIKWKYICDFYDVDSSMSIRMAPKLTHKHIVLAPFMTMRVKLATQVLSHSVAAGINTLCNLGFLSTDASATAEFIETFDQLFDTFNSGTLTSNHKYRKAISSQSGHIPFLMSCLRFLSKIKTGQNTV